MVVIGRKNWIFSDSMDGIRANATMYSLVATAKANGLNPHDYCGRVRDVALSKDGSRDRVSPSMESGASASDSLIGASK